MMPSSCIYCYRQKTCQRRRHESRAMQVHTTSIPHLAPCLVRLYAVCAEGETIALARIATKWPSCHHDAHSPPHSFKRYGFVWLADGIDAFALDGPTDGPTSKGQDAPVQRGRPISAAKSTPPSACATTIATRTLGETEVATSGPEARPSPQCNALPTHMSRRSQEAWLGCAEDAFREPRVGHNSGVKTNQRTDLHLRVPIDRSSGDRGITSPVEVPVISRCGVGSD